MLFLHNPLALGLHLRLELGSCSQLGGEDGAEGCIHRASSEPVGLVAASSHDPAPLFRRGLDAETGNRLGGK